MYIRQMLTYLASTCLIFLLLCLPLVLALDEVKVDNIKVGSGKPYVVGKGGLNVGTVYYIDRTFIVNVMPEELKGVTWIMTANDDKSSVGEKFLQFSVSIPVTVWVARDSRGDKVKGGKTPAWLSEDNGWVRHDNMTIEVTDTNMGNFVLWSKEYDKGDIVLGGNADPPSAGQGSMYIVLLTVGAKIAVEPSGKLNAKWAEIKTSALTI